MAHDVFISHSSKDKPIADAICANLEAAGIRCWIAPRDIVPGEDWPAAITRGISHSHVMVLVFSAYSNSSEDVSRELFLAANSKLVIIPFKIENIEPEPGKQYFLARTHWLDAINPPTKEQIQELVDRVKVLIPPKEPEFIGNKTNAGLSVAATVQADQSKWPVPEQLPGSTAKPVAIKSRISAWLWALPVGVVLLGLLGWAAFSLFLNHPAAPIQPTASPTFTTAPTATTTPIPEAVQATSQPAQPLAQQNVPSSGVCPYQSDSDEATIAKMILAEGEAVNNKDISIIKAIFAADAHLNINATDSHDPVAYYTSGFLTVDFIDATHYDIRPYGPGILGDNAQFISGGSGTVRTQDGSLYPYKNFDNEFWTLNKNQNGCWVITQFISK